MCNAVNFEHISHLILVFLLLTLDMQLLAGIALSLSILLATSVYNLLLLNISSATKRRKSVVEAVGVVGCLRGVGQSKIPQVKQNCGFLKVFEVLQKYLFPGCRDRRTKNILTN